MKIDTVKLCGFIVLFIGVAVLLYTFVTAYHLLIGVLDISGSSEKPLMELFGEVLAPLIIYAIKALYLGIMGWIGSILTRRGVQTITSAPKESKAEEKTNVKEVEEGKETKEPESAENKRVTEVL